MKSNHPSSN